jgi:DNA-binding FadR family transcriptional regulator
MVLPIWMKYDTSELQFTEFLSVVRDVVKILSIAIHRKVCDAIEKRNGKKTERLMLSLLEGANNRLNKKVKGL